MIFAPRLSVSAKGEEVVVSANGKPIYWTDVDQPNFDKTFQDAIATRYLVGVQEWVGNK